MKTRKFIFSAGPDISAFNPLNAELIPICHLLALLGAYHILHVSRIRVNKFRIFVTMFKKHLSDTWVSSTHVTTSPGMKTKFYFL